MIHFRLVQVTRNRQGHPIRVERTMADDTLRIGRGSNCAIHLPDHSVQLLHAVIRDSERGAYYIEGEGTPVCVDGAYHDVAELSAGSRIAIGPYELVVETIAEELAISVEMVRPQPQTEDILMRAPADLAATGLSKRWHALWLALTVTALFLLLPMFEAGNPALRQVLAALPATPLLSWNPGPLLPGHQSFAAQCEKCHDQAFTAVKDDSCVACHRDAAPHVASAAPARRCAECHRDHKGRDGIVRGDRPLCVSCHGDIRRQDAASKLADIRRFDSDHPDFRVTLGHADGIAPAPRVPLSGRQKLAEDSGLKFPHKVHLGKVRRPNNPQTFRAMTCADCHRPGAEGTRFRPVTMKEHCLDCHSEEFDFDPPLPGHRLPHGPERAVMDMVEHYYLSKAAQEGGARLPVTQALAAAKAHAERTTTALTGDMGCGLCHEIDVPGAKGTSWQVRPPAIAGRWLPAARFNHAKHRIEECTGCHDVKLSMSSSDVAIPDRKKCRECHGGEREAHGTIASPCVSCHAYHAAAGR